MKHGTARVFGGRCEEVLDVWEDDTFDSLVTDPPAGISFMGKAWDGDKGGRRQWVKWFAGVMEKALRVVKPGGWGLVWALPRTSSWTGWALEEAGWEVRDRITHLFGQGFPKSLNVGREIDMHLCEHPGRHFDKNLAGRPQAGDHICPPHQLGNPYRGMGTGLKPAAEDWWVVRKTPQMTVADQALFSGTGFLNIDAGRILDDEFDRWPPNVMLTHLLECGDEGCAPGCVVRQLDAQSGKLISGANPAVRHATMFRSTYNPFQGGQKLTPHGLKDVGGASRFFYQAKPTKAEKNAGLAALAKTHSDPSRAEGSLGRKSPRAGANRSGAEANSHPTVKGLEGMMYLLGISTPPGGRPLDPFAGSGSTLVAAALLGMDASGIESDPTSLAICRARIAPAAVAAAELELNRQREVKAKRQEEPLEPEGAVE